MSHPESNLPTIKELESALQQNVNIMGLMRERSRVDKNTPDAILLSYDLQSGSYTSLFEDPEQRSLKNTVNNGIANVIRPLAPKTMLEVGVGEASTLAGVISALGLPASDAAGFDISWSRAAYARRHLKKCGHEGVTLFTGDMAAVPLVDNSYDVVYTAHSMEPNGGRERECLAELYRVAKHWVVLFEPAYELGNEETRQRVEKHGYCCNLPQIARELGYEVVDHSLFAANVWDYNQSQQIIIKKQPSNLMHDSVFACPVCKTALVPHLSQLFCRDCYSVYPVIDGIPCLLAGNGVLATKFLEL